MHGADSCLSSLLVKNGFTTVCFRFTIPVMQLISVHARYRMEVSVKLQSELLSFCRKPSIGILAAVNIESYLMTKGEQSHIFTCSTTVADAGANLGTSTGLITIWAE